MNQLKLQHTLVKLLIFIALSTTAWRPSNAQSTCTFTLLPSSSQVTLAGKVVSPVESELTNVDTTTTPTLSGTLTLNAPCPPDLASLSQLLTTPNALSGNLKLSPDNISLKAGALATLVWVDVGFATDVKFSTQGGPADVTMAINEGYVLSSSLLSSNPDRVEIQGLSASSVSTPTVSQSGTNGIITIPSIAMTWQSIYESTFGGAPLRGVSNYTLQGTIIASTPLTAPTVDTPTPAPTPSSIIIPIVPPTPAPAPVATPAPAPTPSPAVPCIAPTVCTGREVYNSITATCDCPTGWTGTGCTACTIGGDSAAGNKACTAEFGKNATCNGEYPYLENTIYKSYVCDLKGTGLNDLIEDGTFKINCNTTTSAAGGGGGSQKQGGQASSSNALNPGDLASNDPLCEVQFALKNKGTNPLTCIANMCTFEAGSSVATCLSTSCTCAKDCPDVQGVLDVIDGNPATISCDTAGECTFDIKDFFIKLVAPCTTHQCLVDNYIMVTEKYDTNSSDNYDPIIAAVPLMVVTAVTAILGGYLFAHRSLFNAASNHYPTTTGTTTGTIMSNTTTTSGVGGVHHTRGVGGVVGGSASSSIVNFRPAYPVGQLQFENVSCRVPVPGSGNSKWRKMFGGSGSSGDDVSVVDGDGMRTVLHSTSGIATAGELVGILGPSGSGKTTLLSLLTGSPDGHSTGTATTGLVTLDGQPIPAGRIAYCPQDSTLLPTLTVEECLRYSALLRLPKNWSPEKIQSTVAGVIQELGLKKVAHSRVGSSDGGKRGVSGGERRRVSIGMELVTNPSVVLLDEPSSGLDSHTAYNLMVTLKQVASSGRIVALSFHQPSPAMFNLLDRVFLMTQGHCVFSGPPAAAESWLAEIGLPCPSGTAVAEQMLYSANDATLLPLMLKRASIDQFEKQLSSKNNNNNTSTTSGIIEHTKSPSSVTDTTQPDYTSTSTSTSTTKTAGISRELAVLFWRTVTDMARNPSLVLLHWGTAALVGVFVGAIFWQVGVDISGAQNRAGGLFFALAFFGFTSLTTVDLLVAERHLVRREVAGAYYRPVSYLLSKIVLDGLLLRAIPVFLYSASFYPMMGLQSGSVQVATFLMTLCTFALVAGALSIAITIGAGTAGKASFIMNLILLISLLVGGFFVNVASIPSWIAWLHYLSPFFYGYSVLVTNEMSTLLLDFVVEGYAAVKNVRGLTFLRIIGVNASSMTTYIIVLDCMYAIAVIFAFGLLYLKMPRGGSGRGSSSATAKR